VGCGTKHGSDLLRKILRRADGKEYLAELQPAKQEHNWQCRAASSKLLSCLAFAAREELTKRLEMCGCAGLSPAFVHLGGIDVVVVAPATPCLAKAPVQHSFAAGALAKLATDIRRDVLVRGTPHHLQRLADFAVGEHVQERRLSEFYG